MKGLEISEIKLSALENDRTIGAEYYAPMFLQPTKRLLAAGVALGRLRDLCSRITDGDHGSADYADKGVPFILSEAVNEAFIDKAKCRAITPAYAATLDRSRLHGGDVLVTKTGVYYGKSAVVPSSLTGANTIAHVGILRPKREVNPYFLSTFLNSRFGHAQLRRRGIKATRPEIKLVEFSDILVPQLSSSFQEAIEREIREALKQLDASRDQISQADEMLLEELGLSTWSSQDALSYHRRARDVFAAARYDADYFAPRVQKLIKKLSAQNLTIADVAPLRRKYFKPKKGDAFDYIEIGDLTQEGEATSTRLDGGVAPSRATWHVRSGDIITSTVRPIRRLTALIQPDQDNFVCSSGFAVLQPKSVPSELLLVYLRLPSICQLMDLHTTASMYPAIAVSEILTLPFLMPSDAGVEKIVAQIRSARVLRHRAEVLIERARRAVEVAIESSESAGLMHLR